jgi:hypothetical protein
MCQNDIQPLCFEEACAKHDIKSAQRYGVQVNNEAFLVNRARSMFEEAMAGHFIIISNRDPEAAIGGEGHPHDGGQLLMDEVVSATRIQQGDEVTIPDTKSQE